MCSDSTGLTALEQLRLRLSYSFAETNWYVALHTRAVLTTFDGFRLVDHILVLLADDFLVMAPSPCQVTSSKSVCVPLPFSVDLNGDWQICPPFSSDSNQIQAIASLLQVSKPVALVENANT